MNGRSILCSLLMIAGCSGGAQKDEDTDKTVPAGTGDILKITYIRFNFDARKKRYYPVYRVMVSESWRAKYGSTSREPFNKLFPARGSRAPYFGVVQNRRMRAHVATLQKRGLNDLQAMPPGEIDLVRLSQVYRSEIDARKTRIITVGGEGWEKSYTFRKNNADKDSIRRFFACETLVVQMGNAYTAQISVQAMPIRRPR